MGYWINVIGCFNTGIVRLSGILGYLLSWFRIRVVRLSAILRCLIGCVVGVMKMGNNVPRAGLEPTSLTFWASVRPLHHIGFPDVTNVPMPTCLKSCLPQRSVHTTTHGSGVVLLSGILRCLIGWFMIRVVLLSGILRCLIGWFMIRVAQLSGILRCLIGWFMIRVAQLSGILRCLIGWFMIRVAQLSGILRCLIGWFMIRVVLLSGILRCLIG